MKSVPRPAAGGRYTRDPETGKLTRANVGNEAGKAAAKSTAEGSKPQKSGAAKKKED